MGAKKAANRRHNYFIEKKFQSEFIVRFCLLVVLTAMIFSYVIYCFSLNSVTTVFENSRLIIKPSSEYIMPGLAAGSLVAVIIVSLATIGVVLFISHRIAGPLFKFKKCLEMVKDGDFSFKIYLRESDEAKHMAEGFNEMTVSLNKMMGDVKSCSDALENKINASKESADITAGVPKDLKQAFSDIKKQHVKLKESLEKFTLE